METKKPRKITPEEVVEIRERFSGQMDEMVQNLNRRAWEAIEAEGNPGNEVRPDRSLVAAEKREAYFATNYCLGCSPAEVVLNIGKYNPRLTALFTEHRVTCGAFITAYNPEGTQQSTEANAHDHAALLAEVVALGLPFIEGEGADATGEWPAERSVFAYGMDKVTACRVGRQFHQDAIVWVGPDAVPQLVMLR